MFRIVFLVSTLFLVVTTGAYADGFGGTLARILAEKDVGDVQEYQRRIRGPSLNLGQYFDFVYNEFKEYFATEQHSTTLDLGSLVALEDLFERKAKRAQKFEELRAANRRYCLLNRNLHLEFETILNQSFTPACIRFLNTRAIGSISRIKAQAPELYQKMQNDFSQYDPQAHAKWVQAQNREDWKQSLYWSTRAQSEFCGVRALDTSLKGFLPGSSARTLISQEEMMALIGMRNKIVTKSRPIFAQLLKNLEDHHGLTRCMIDPTDEELRREFGELSFVWE